ncbi:MAG: hypothetical protein IJW96_01715, partial [Clostridia bacterium]|nr:hypothetical protein [Clostridia bacterium]
AGGKFGQGNYEYSGGLHGVGASVTNALSEWLTVEVCRDRRIYKMSFHSKYNARKKKIESGIPDGPLEDTGITTSRKGSFVRFKPDATVFSETNFDLETVEERLRQLAFLNRGIEIILVDERITMAEARRSRMLFASDEEEDGEDENGKEEESLEEAQENLFGQLDALALDSEPYRVTFKYDGGISDYVKSLNEGKKKLYSQPIYYKATKNNIQVEFSIQHTGEYRECMFSFVNNIPTPEGGYHEIGFRSGLTRVLNEYARSNGFLKDKDANLQGMTSAKGLRLSFPSRWATCNLKGRQRRSLVIPKRVLR